MSVTRKLPKLVLKSSQPDCDDFKDKFNIVRERHLKFCLSPDQLKRMDSQLGEKHPLERRSVYIPPVVKKVKMPKKP